MLNKETEKIIEMYNEIYNGSTVSTFFYEPWEDENITKYWNFQYLAEKAIEEMKKEFEIKGIKKEKRVFQRGDLRILELLENIVKDIKYVVDHSGKLKYGMGNGSEKMIKEKAEDIKRNIETIIVILEGQREETKYIIEKTIKEVGKAHTIIHEIATTAAKIEIEQYEIKRREEYEKEREEKKKGFMEDSVVSEEEVNAAIRAVRRKKEEEEMQKIERKRQRKLMFKKVRLYTIYTIVGLIFIGIAAICAVQTI